MAGRRHTLLKRPELVEQYAENIELGLSYRLSAQMVGISEDSASNWMRDGQEAIEERSESEIERDPKLKALVGFFRRIKMAEAQAAKSAVTTIRDAATHGQWQAAAWLLERRYPDEYGRERVWKDGGDSLRAAAIVIPGVKLPPEKKKKRK